MAAKKKPRVLITNDDGIHAPGIRFLWQALKDIADVTVIAPATEQSAAALSLTLRHPLRIEATDTFPHTPAWIVSGTPADCVKLGLSVILPEPPDFILSGINRGSNAGRTLLYSGTVACVIEGVMRNIPGIAFSCMDFHHPNYAQGAEYIPALFEYVLAHPPAKGTLLNVNFPSNGDHPRIKGIKLTRQGKEYLAENPEKRQHPAEGSSYYWLGVQIVQFDEEDDCDVNWLRQGYATVVPIHVHELTDHAHLLEHKAHFAQRFK